MILSAIVGYRFYLYRSWIVDQMNRAKAQAMRQTKQSFILDGSYGEEKPGRVSR